MGRFVRSFVVLVAVPACGFDGSSNPGPSPNSDAGTRDAAVAVDAAIPVTCGSLTCDPRAICNAGPPATCSCPPGFDDPGQNGLACNDRNECASGESCPDEMACQNTPGSFVCYTPKTCKDAHDHMAPPGDTRLYFTGDHSKPWLAFCDGDDTYLTLPQGSGKNYAQYTHNIPQTTDRRITYLRIRIDPDTLIVDLANDKYTSASGNTSYSAGFPPVDKVSYGVAIACSPSATGSANVDLSGLPFRVKHDQTSPWSLGGNMPTGTATPSNNDQTWAITASGKCGWAAPAPAPINQAPINGNAGTSRLQLDYIGP